MNADLLARFKTRQEKLEAQKAASDEAERHRLTAQTVALRPVCAAAAAIHAEFMPEVTFLERSATCVIMSLGKPNVSGRLYIVGLVTAPNDKECVELRYQDYQGSPVTKPEKVTALAAIDAMIDVCIRRGLIPRNQ